MKVKANRVADFDAAKNPGDYFIAGGRLSFLCPCGCGDLCGIKVRDDGKQMEGAWGWNLNADCPTCTPSILVFGPAQSTHWHGYLTDGEFVSC